MNITIISAFPPYRGGISDFNIGLVKELAIKNNVSCLNFTTQYPRLLFPGKTQYKTDGKKYDIPVVRMLSSINLFSWYKSAHYVIRLNPDVIIFRYWLPFFAPSFGKVARLIKKKIDCKILIICDNIIPHERRLFDTSLTRYFFNTADGFIVMSKLVENDLLMLYPEAIYRYSPHPIYNMFGNGVTKEKARKKLKLKEKKILLCFGLIRRYKGVDLLIRAVGKLKYKLQDFRFIIAGECYEDEIKYTELIKEQEVEDVVDFRPVFIPDDDVKYYFSAADVVVLPYRTATQSGIVQIAYHFNRPVIVTNVGGLPEIVADGEVGYVVNPTAEEIADAIYDFYTEKKVDDFVVNLNVYKERYSWGHFVNNVEEVILQQ